MRKLTAAALCALFFGATLVWAQTINRARVVSGTAVTIAPKTCNSGTSTCTVSGAIPAGCYLMGVSIRVTTILAGTGLTTWSAGLHDDADRFATGKALAVGTTVVDTDYASDFAPAFYSTAHDLILTAAAGQFDSGVILYSISCWRTGSV